MGFGASNSALTFQAPHMEDLGKRAIQVHPLTNPLVKELSNRHIFRQRHLADAAVEVLEGLPKPQAGRMVLLVCHA